jgi:hypothetical protein
MLLPLFARITELLLMNPFELEKSHRSPLPSGLPRRRREEAFNGREERILVERLLGGQQPSLFDSNFSLLQRVTYNERKNSFQLFSRVQPVIEDDAIGVGREYSSRISFGGMPPCAESVLFLGACNTSSSSLVVIDYFQPGLAGLNKLVYI